MGIFNHRVNIRVQKGFALEKKLAVYQMLFQRKNNFFEKFRMHQTLRPYKTSIANGAFRTTQIAHGSRFNGHRFGKAGSERQVKNRQYPDEKTI